MHLSIPLTLFTTAVLASHHRPSCVPSSSPARWKTCYVDTANDLKTDDTQNILAALKDCNNGGHAIFNATKSYFIASAMDLTFLNQIDIDIRGKLLFSNDTDYWQANSFKQIFQNATTFFELGGTDVNVYGGGLVDGNGQVWYDLYAKNEYILRPILFGTIGLHSGVIANLNLRNSPQYYNFVANSTNVIFNNISISGASTSKNPAKNTDGWDIYRSSYITIENSHINNGDDCVSFKPNSTNILVQNLHCNGSHGISVGSLGQYPSETDIVENLYIFNNTLTNATDGARIKVWPGAPAALSGDLQGGGGSGRVRNVTYDTMYIDNVDYAIEVTQCYGQKNTTECFKNPANLTISDISFKNFFGTTSKTYSPFVGTIVCSSGTACENISVENFQVKNLEGGQVVTCQNVDDGLLQGVNCTTTLTTTN